MEVEDDEELDGESEIEPNQESSDPTPWGGRRRRRWFRKPRIRLPRVRLPRIRIRFHKIKCALKCRAFKACAKHAGAVACGALTTNCGC